jgi:hypothetical protein
MGKIGKLAMLGSARKAAKQNASSVHGGIDKVASALKGAVGARHAAKVDKGSSLLKKAVTGTDRPAGNPPRAA